MASTPLRILVWERWAALKNVPNVYSIIVSQKLFRGQVVTWFLCFRPQGTNTTTNSSIWRTNQLQFSISLFSFPRLMQVILKEEITQIASSSNQIWLKGAIYLGQLQLPMVQYLIRYLSFKKARLTGLVVAGSGWANLSMVCFLLITLMLAPVCIWKMIKPHTMEPHSQM